jgi:hypothetical protein
VKKIYVEISGFCTTGGEQYGRQHEKDRYHGDIKRCHQQILPTIDCITIPHAYETGKALLNNSNNLEQNLHR